MHHKAKIAALKTMDERVLAPVGKTEAAIKPTTRGVGRPSKNDPRSLAAKAIKENPALQGAKAKILEKLEAIAPEDEKEEVEINYYRVKNK